MRERLFVRVDRARPGFLLPFAGESYKEEGERFAGLPRSTSFRQRSDYQRAARDLHRQGLTPRDIGAALRIGTEAAAQLLEPTRAS